MPLGSEACVQILFEKEIVLKISVDFCLIVFLKKFLTAISRLEMFCEFNGIFVNNFYCHIPTSNIELQFYIEFSQLFILLIVTIRKPIDISFKAIFNLAHYL